MAKLTLSPDELSKIGTPVQKGRRLELGDLDKQPRRFTGAGWDELQIQGMDVDLDLVTLLLCVDDSPKDERTESGLYVKSRDRLVHYNPKDRTKKVRDDSGAVEYQGDSVTGAESKDDEDELVLIDYPRIPQDVSALMTFVNIHKQSNSPQFIKDLTFDGISRPFASSFPEGAEKDPTRKRVISLLAFGGVDTVVIKFDWRKPDGSWDEEFVEKHVEHRPEFQGQPNAGFLSAVYAYGVGN
jgi:stress response protein SCP2